MEKKYVNVTNEEDDLHKFFMIYLSERKQHDEKDKTYNSLMSYLTIKNQNRSFNGAMK